MSKQTKKPSSSVTEIIRLFKISPELAYQNLIDSGHYFYTIHSKRFWSRYDEIDFHQLHHQFPDTVETFNKVIWLRYFFDINEFYKAERNKIIDALIALNPDETSLIKSLFLCLELGESSDCQSNFPKYSLESLEGIKILLREILPQLKNEDKTDYSIELVQHANNLIKIHVDNAMVAEFLDAFVWAGFSMSQKNDFNGYLLKLNESDTKQTNRYVLNQLKTIIKLDYKRTESHPKISEEEHFKKNDPKWKSNEGFASVFIEGGTDVKQAVGMTFLKLEDGYFADSKSYDPKKRAEFEAKFMKDMLEQSFQVRFRDALSQIYQPNDEIDIHALHIEIEQNIFVSLYELICAMSCLIARADAYRYISDLPDSGSIVSIKRMMHSYFLQQKPELSSIEIDNLVNTEIVHHLKLFDDHYKQKTFQLFSEDTLINWLKKIEELKTKSTIELRAIINLFSSFDLPTKINVLFKIKEKFYFSHATCVKLNLNRIIYDNYISDKLFNSNSKNQHLNEKQLIGENHKNREAKFTSSLKELFQKVTPYVESSLKYGAPESNYDFGDLKGEFDVLAYFESENIVFPIQVKLSNVSPRSEMRKDEWINNRIKKKGIQQVLRDVKLLQSKSGLKFVEDKLKTKNEISSPIIYPIIITDNFFGDHLSFPFNESGNSVFCISYFELKHLLLNQKIHDKQRDWHPIENKGAATQIMDLIESNAFWNFLDELAPNFTFSKSLSAINKELTIEMMV